MRTWDINKGIVKSIVEKQNCKIKRPSSLFLSKELYFVFFFSFFQLTAICSLLTEINLISSYPKYKKSRCHLSSTIWLVALLYKLCK